MPDLGDAQKENWDLVVKVAAALLKHKRFERADLLELCGL